MAFRSVPISIKLDESTPEKKPIPKRIQVMRCGKFCSDEYGEFEITPAHLLSMKKNFEENVRGIDLAVDYKHEAEDIAAGWFKDIFLSEDGKELWAEVEWTPNGEKVLSDKEFRYISADFHFDFTHNETKQKHGPTLFGAGLTNRPFIKNMDPVVELSEKGNKKMDDKDKKIAELEAKIAELTQKLEGKKDDSNSDASPEMKQQMDDMKKKIEAYEASAQQAAEEKKLAEKKGSFDKLLSEGKAVEVQREAFMSGDAMKFAELAQPVNLSGKGSSESPNVTQVKSKEEAEKEILKLAEAKVKEKKVANLGEGIRAVLSESPELKNKYHG
jgi:phage I-like protein